MFEAARNTLFRAASIEWVYGWGMCWLLCRCRNLEAWNPPESASDGRTWT